MDFEWIEKYSNESPARLRLKYGHEYSDEILQIEMRRKHAGKFARTLRENPRFIFPGALAAEQSTSELLARFHASLVNEGDHVADLTAGLGIDAMAFAEKAKDVVAVERNPEIANALRHNSAQLPNLSVLEGDCTDYVRQWAEESRRFDDIFIDPARRDDEGKRIFAISDCEPDVSGMLSELRKITPRLIIKASPMLDITFTVRQLNQDNRRDVEQAIALGTTTECKELDIVCDFEKSSDVPLIRAVTVAPGVDSEFAFTWLEEESAVAKFGIPGVGDYVFDPYPAVMKAGPFRLLGQRFCLDKIGANTHLWCGKSPVEDFPGHAFKVLEVLPYMSKHIKRYASRYPRVAVTARNFDISSDTLRTKLKVSEGPLRLFAVNAFNGQKLLITCERYENNR